MRTENEKRKRKSEDEGKEKIGRIRRQEKRSCWIKWIQDGGSMEVIVRG